MTDARYPERWLNDRRVVRLSDGAHRLFVVALTWSVSNRTDGIITDDDLKLLPRVNTHHEHELLTNGLWQREANQWVIVDFAATQTTRSELETLEKVRAAEREKKRRQRAAKAAQQRPVPGDSPGDISGDDTGKASARTGLDASVDQAEEHSVTCGCSECVADLEHELAEAHR